MHRISSRDYGIVRELLLDPLALGRPLPVRYHRRVQMLSGLLGGVLNNFPAGRVFVTQRYISYVTQNAALYKCTEDLYR